MLKKTLKRNKGITLIALVVTIIVLLILAGISISMLTGQNGILNRAAEAKEKTGIAQEDEKEKLQGYEDTINKYVSGSNDLSDYQTTDTKPYLPDTTKFEKVAGTDLSTGLVMKEKATGSEYVWVEVPKTTVFTTALNITEFTDDDYTKIENDLHTYTNDYRNGTSFSDTWYDASKDSNEKNLSDWYSESDYNTAKKKMLKSVYQNGGFWVGRYEAGIEDEANIRKAKTDTVTLTPITKQNMYPYTYVTRTQAKKLAEQVESGSYTSSLMFGVQWDLVLKYIESKNATTQANLKTNSTTIGNYYNSSFTLNRGKFAQYGALSNWYDFDSEKKTSLVTGKIKQVQSSYSNGILLTTGSTEATNLQNIYDIAGNVWEWTLEYTSNTDNPCASRGGSCGSSGSTFPASGSILNSTSYSGGIGFRVSLY